MGKCVFQLCQLCCRDDNEAQLLLCDICDRGYHTYCIKVCHWLTAFFIIPVLASFIDGFIFLLSQGAQLHFTMLAAVLLCNRKWLILNLYRIPWTKCRKFLIVDYVSCYQIWCKSVCVSAWNHSIPFILNQTTRVHTQKHTNHTYTYTYTNNILWLFLFINIFFGLAYSQNPWMDVDVWWLNAAESCKVMLCGVKHQKSNSKNVKIWLKLALTQGRHKWREQ